MLWSAFLIGWFGSFHCLGMCGPIALSLPQANDSYFKRIINVSLYNIGRILSYSVLGLIIGFAGKGLILSGTQKWISIIIGVFLIITALFSINVEAKIIQISWMQKFYSKIQNLLSNYLRSGGKKSFFFIGYLNGLLPCGLVYMAIAGAIVSSSLLNSILYMFIFGVGTLPMMFFLGIAGNSFPPKIRFSIRKMYPYFIIAMGLLFLYRGMNADVSTPIINYLDKNTCK